MSPTRPLGRIRSRTRPKQGRSFVFLGLVAVLLSGLAGGLLIYASLSSRPIPQAFYAAFPEGLLGPGRAELLVRLEDPVAGRPLAGQVRVLIEGSGRRKEIGLARIEGTAPVPFQVPDLKQGGYRLVAEVLGALKEEELSADVDVDAGNRLSLMTDAREFRPGESVRVLGLGRRLDPARPAAGEPWALSVIGPRGNRLLRAQGITDAGGGFALEVPLPASTPGGRFGLEAEIGQGLLGYREIQVAGEPAFLQVRPRLSEPYAVAGETLRGEVEVLGADGLPVLGGRVRVGLPQDLVGFQSEGKSAAAGEWVEATASGPGLHAFALSLPALVPGVNEPRPLELEARVLEPGAEREVQAAFRVFIQRSRHRLVVEAPARWVEGLPHRIRVEVVDLGGAPVPAELEVLHGQDVVARGAFEGRGSLPLTLIPPPACKALLIRAVGPEGVELCTREIGLEPPPVPGQDFSLALEESVLAPGAPLRLEIFSKRQEDRLWVDLLVEGMVTALFPVTVEQGASTLEIPAQRLPTGLFQVRVWRWDLKEVPSFEVSCLAQDNGALVVPLETFLTRLGEEEAGIDLPVPGSMAVTARTGPLTPFAFPEPVTGALALMPGTFGLPPSGRFQLLRALAGGAPLPPVREELVPFILESWSGYGPPILAVAESRLQLGLALLGLALLGAVGVGVARWGKFRSGRPKGMALIVLCLGLGGAAVRAQEPPAPLPKVDILPVPPWWWGGLAGETRALAPHGGLPAEAGVQHLGLGGQGVREGSLLLGWGEFIWAPGWECRAAAQGPLWPGDEVKITCWWRLAGSSGPSGVLQVSAGSGPPVGVPFLGPWIWHRGDLELGALDPGQASIPVLGRDAAGAEFVLGSLPISHPPAQEVRQTWAQPFGGRVGFLVPQALAGRERLRLERIPGPRFLAHRILRGLWAEPGDGGQLFQSPWGSLDRVLGWGRLALSVLDEKRGTALPPEEQAELEELAGRTLQRAWMELTTFEKSGGGFGPFPATQRDLVSTAAALEFLVDGGRFLPEASAGAMAARTARLLGLVVREDGSVPTDAGTLAMGLWANAGDGRFYHSALVGAALARFRAKEFLFGDIEAFLTVRLQEPCSLLERLAAARALLSWNPADALGRTQLEEAAREAGGGLPRAGLHAWTGAGGIRADLLATGLLATALQRAELAPQRAAQLRAQLRAGVDADHGWGDPWTTAVCLEALLSAPEGAAGARGEARVLVGGKEVWRGAQEDALDLDLGPRPGQGPFEVALEEGEDAPEGFTLLTLTRGLEPWTVAGTGSLSLSWMPVTGEPQRLGLPVLARLQVTNTTPETIARILVEIQPSAAFTILPDRLARAVRSGEVVRADWTPGGTRFWLTHLSAKFTRTVALRVVPRVQGRASLPRARAMAAGLSEEWAASERVVLEIRE